MNSLYKRKSIKFSNEQFSRANRKAEVLKARESSRFRHLSTTRDLTDEENSIKSADKENPRAMMLLKWKQEKEFRKYEEMKVKKKPFYAGGYQVSRYTPNKDLQNMKSSFMDQTTSRIFNASKSVKSRLVDSKSSALSSKIPSVSRQMDSKSSSQLSKIPSISKQASVDANKNIKKTVIKSDFNGKSAIKTNSLKSTNQTSSSCGFNKNDRPTIKNTFNEKNSTKANGSSLKTVNQTSSSCGFNKNGRSTVKNAFNEKNFTKANGSSLKTVNQESSASKITTSKFPNKPVQKILTPSTTQKCLVPPKSHKIPSMKQEYPFALKPPQKNPRMKQEIPVPSKSQKEFSTKNITTRKGYCFKNFITSKQQTDNASKTKKPNEEMRKMKMSDKDEKSKPEVEVICQQSQLNNPDKTLNWDISIIKPKSSFAPDDFKFKPPALLSDFVFEDEEDPDEILEQIKVKYMNRTSTPSKETERSNDSKYSLDSACKESANKNSSQGTSSTTDVKHSSENASPSVEAKGLSQNESLIMEVKNSPKTSFNKPRENYEIPRIDSYESKPTDLLEFLASANMKPSESASPLKEVKDLSQNESLIMDVKNLPKTSFNKPRENYEILRIDSCESKPTDSLEFLASANMKPSESASSMMVVKNSPKNGSPLKEVEDLSQKQSLMNSPETSFNKTRKKDDVLRIDNCVSKPTNSLELSACSDSPLNILNLSEMKDDFEELDLLKLQDEEINATNIPKESECARRKSEILANLNYKRVSMLKISTLNAIAEADGGTDQSFGEASKENRNTPRRSKRLSASSCQKANIIKESIPEENTVQYPSVTPRRSLRLQKKVEHATPQSPFQQPKSRQQPTLRRSLRLIDLNTPESDSNKACSKSNLTADFQKLKLDDSEHLDPNNFMSDLEDSPVTSGLKSRKVSLLYSPEKNRPRMSVRGDLMAFSPN